MAAAAGRAIFAAAEFVVAVDEQQQSVEAVAAA